VGGYGSGGHNRRRITADACIRLDVAMLRRAGLIAPENMTLCRWSYSTGGRPSCTVAVVARPGVASVDVVIVLPDGQTHTQAVNLTWQPTPWGARRHLFKCPACHARAHRLYYYSHTFSNGRPVHRFLCRRCLGLTYATKQARGFDLYQDRCAAQHRRAKAWAAAHGQTVRQVDGLAEWDWPPDRPKGMHQATYERIYAKWEAANHEAQTAWGARLAAMLGDKALSGFLAGD
jgi:hypothetical protein